MRARQAATLGAALVLLAACTNGSDGSSPSSGPGTSVGTPSTTPASSPGSGTAGRPADWPVYHYAGDRSGNYPSMPAAAGPPRVVTKLELDGQVYASPIVVAGTVIVATEKNQVYGLSTTGEKKWSVGLGTPTSRSDLPCGNIDPLGITGTPVYDAASRTVFLVASIGAEVRHELIAFNPATGAIRWRRSIDLPGADQTAMQQRGALTVLAGRVWVPFGGLAGDCGDYKGRLVGVPVGNGEPVEYTVPTTREGGIWTPPGPSVFSGNLLVAVGNGESVGGRYDFSDSVLKLAGTTLVDSFSPRSWATDNAGDLDLGSQGPALVQGKWIFIAGKSGQGYVLRADRLGGVGGEVSQATVCRSFGGTAVVGGTVYVPCSDGLRAVRIAATGRLSTSWHAETSIQGSPVVGGGRIYAVDQDSGELCALDPASGRVRERASVGKVSRFATPAISGDRLFVPTLTGLSILDTGA
jgi:outer membrane protein assembly factor BamB